MSLAPIVLFVYNRLWHARRVIEALKKNELASESEFFIYSDAAKNEKAIEQVNEVRKYIKQIDGFKKITIIEREKNCGLANSIIGGVTEIINEFGKIVVLEDDLLTSPYLLRFMNEALCLFSEDDRVVSIHGWRFPTNVILPEAFFLRGADCWGWSTWRRGWDLFNPNGQALLEDIDRRGLRKAFDVNGTYPYSKMLEDQIKGVNDSWAIRWYASAFLAEKLTLYPGRSLVHNIGNDSSGTHCSKTDMLDVKLSSTRIDLKYVNVTPSIEGRAAQEDFFRRTQGGLVSKVLDRIKRVVSKVVS